MSQETLAKLIDYDRSNYRKMEVGEKPFPEDLLERIGKELDTPAERLIALKILDQSSEEVCHWLKVELDKRAHQTDLKTNPENPCLP